MMQSQQFLQREIKIVFTSTRSGDIELYTMNIDADRCKTNYKSIGILMEVLSFRQMEQKLFSVLLDLKRMLKLRNTKIC